MKKRQNFDNVQKKIDQIEDIYDELLNFSNVPLVLSKNKPTLSENIIIEKSSNEESETKSKSEELFDIELSSFEPQQKLKLDSSIT